MEPCPLSSPLAVALHACCSQSSPAATRSRRPQAATSRRDSQTLCKTSCSLSPLFLRCFCACSRHSIWTRRAVSLLEFFARAHRLDVNDAVHGQDAVEVVDFVLQKFRKIPLFASLNFVPLRAQILITHFDLTMPLHLHEDRQETQARIPYHYLLRASPGDFQVNTLPRVFPGQSQENHAQTRTNLWRGDSPAIARRLPPIRKRVRQVLDQRPYLRCCRIVHFLRDFA